MSDELISVGGLSNKKRLKETETTAVVREEVYTFGQPSTEAIGLVGGNTVFVQVNLAPTTSGAYAANDVIGGSVSVPGVFRSTSMLTGLLQSLVTADKSTMQSAIDFVFFHTDTTGTTYTNDSALTLADGDLGKAIGTISLQNSDYIAFVNNCLGTVRNLGFPVRATTGTGLTFVPINRSTGPIYTSTGDLVCTLGFLVD